MKCQKNIQELQRELEKVNNEKVMLQDKNENSRQLMIDFEIKYKEEKQQSEQLRGNDLINP